jgi:hypothetical protein
MLDSMVMGGKLHLPPWMVQMECAWIPQEVFTSLIIRAIAFARLPVEALSPLLPVIPTTTVTLIMEDTLEMEASLALPYCTALEA